MSKTKQQKQRQLLALTQQDKQEELNQALTMLLAWTNSTSLALFLRVSQNNLDDFYRAETGSGVALFHSNSIPFASQALDLAIVNA